MYFCIHIKETIEKNPVKQIIAFSLNIERNLIISSVYNTHIVFDSLKNQDLFAVLDDFTKDTTINLPKYTFLLVHFCDNKCTSIRIA